MKKVVVTQRVDVTSTYGERRDCLDQRWIELLLSVGLFPVLVPNNLDYVKKLIATEQIDGVLLTGGNSLLNYGGDAPERDEVEKNLLELAILKNIPLLGVCRGMQIIQNYFGNALEKITGHVGIRHSLIVENGCYLTEVLSSFSDVNAYHDFGTSSVSGELVCVATSVDGVVMAVEHGEKSIYGVMWHSEREMPICKYDKVLLKKIFL